MATIIPDPQVNSLVPDTKPAFQVESREVAPEPELSNSISIEAMRKGHKIPPKRPISPAKPPYKEVIIKPMPGEEPRGPPTYLPMDPPHPIYPGGDLLEDVQTHVRCQEMFTLNVQRLITEFLTMKVDLAKARTDLRDTQRKLWNAESDRDKYKQSSDQFELDLKEAEKDLKTTKEALQDATKRLAETTEQLTQVKADVKSLKRDLADSKRRIAGLQQDLQYHMDRLKSLEEELRRANSGENAANDRNTELTRLLYRVEGDKARIEREKDKELERANHLQDQIVRREREVEDLKEQLKRKK